MTGRARPRLQAHLEALAPPGISLVESRPLTATAWRLSCENENGSRAVPRAHHLVPRDAVTSVACQRARRKASKAAWSSAEKAGRWAALAAAWTASASGSVRRSTSSRVRALPSLK